MKRQLQQQDHQGQNQQPKGEQREQGEERLTAACSR